MKISRFLKQTTIDYPEKIASMVFTSGCNLRCPACYSKQTIEGKSEIFENEVFDYINKINSWKKFIDGIVICGGEPTIHSDLPNFCRKAKGLELDVKLDTNGTNPGRLATLRDEKLVDYVAMDVKGPVRLYPQIIGLGEGKWDLRDNLGKGIGIVAGFPEHEYRTTMVPIYKNGKPRWMTEVEVKGIAKLIYEWTGSKEHAFYLQPFLAMNKEEMMDERFTKDKLPKEFWETPVELMQKYKKALLPLLPQTKIRGE